MERIKEIRRLNSQFEEELQSTLTSCSLSIDYNRTVVESFYERILNLFYFLNSYRDRLELISARLNETQRQLELLADQLNQ